MHLNVSLQHSELPNSYYQIEIKGDQSYTNAETAIKKTKTPRLLGLQNRRL